ncbi:MAG TPA: four-helix bundle copper-binding protein [Clostridiaceae bacterium]|nr:four-helix bundle copper-binding protein [Clostridiaceae bacterium]
MIRRKIMDKKLMTTLQDCMIACNHCFDACLKEDDVKMMAECIRLDRECADVCGFVSAQLTKEGKVTKDLVAVCAKICDLCAEECEKHEHEHCKACAKSCRTCSEACRNHSA